MGTVNIAVRRDPDDAGLSGKGTLCLYLAQDVTTIFQFGKDGWPGVCLQFQAVTRIRKRFPQKETRAGKCIGRG